MGVYCVTVPLPLEVIRIEETLGGRQYGEPTGVQVLRANEIRGIDQRVLLLISDAGQIGIEVMHEITLGSRERACEREVRECSQPSP